jgi:hypothetical protein
MVKKLRYQPYAPKCEKTPKWEQKEEKTHSHKCNCAVSGMIGVQIHDHLGWAMDTLDPVDGREMLIRWRSSRSHKCNICSCCWCSGIQAHEYHYETVVNIFHVTTNSPWELLCVTDKRTRRVCLGCSRWMSPLTSSSSSSLLFAFCKHWYGLHCQINTDVVIHGAQQRRIVIGKTLQAICSWKLCLNIVPQQTARRRKY